MGSVERMVRHAIGIAEDNSHGYSWADRWNVDRDCSSLMYDSADAAGYPVGRGPDRARYTGTMVDDFTAAGFDLHPYGSVELRRGDVLLAHNASRKHTEMYVGGGKAVGAHIAETGGVYGQPGDQTGDEISVAPLSGRWDWVLRPRELEDDMSEYTQAHDNVYTKQEGVRPQDQVDWIDGRVAELHDALLSPADASGRGKEASVPDRLAWMAAKQEAQAAELAEVKEMAQDILDKLDAMARGRDAAR